jgi:hypothetical protein
MQAIFDRVDSNGDGFIDATEAAALRQRAGGGRPDGQSGESGAANGGPNGAGGQP